MRRQVLWTRGCMLLPPASAMGWQHLRALFLRPGCMFLHQKAQCLGPLRMRWGPQPAPQPCGLGLERMAPGDPGLPPPFQSIEELGSLMACSPPRAGHSAGPFPAMVPHFIPEQAHRAGITTHSTDVKPRKMIQQGGQGHLPAQNMSLRRPEPQFPYL